MGRRGPAPTPTDLKLLRGESRPSRLGSGEPQPRALAPVAPPWLSKDALAVWEATVAELAHRGNAFAGDSHQLAAYCNCVVNAGRAQQRVDASDVILIGEHRTVVSNPASREAARWMTLALVYAREFGLTPAARVNLASSTGPIEDSRDVAARLLS